MNSTLDSCRRSGQYQYGTKAVDGRADYDLPCALLVDIGDESTPVAPFGSFNRQAESSTYVDIEFDTARSVLVKPQLESATGTCSQNSAAARQVCVGKTRSPVDGQLNAVGDLL